MGAAFRWSAADAAWQRRLIGDPELQQRYAAAMQAAERSVASEPE